MPKRPRKTSTSLVNIPTFTLSVKMFLKFTDQNITPWVTIPVYMEKEWQQLVSTLTRPNFCEAHASCLSAPNGSAAPIYNEPGSQWPRDRGLGPRKLMVYVPFPLDNTTRLIVCSSNRRHSMSWLIGSSFRGTQWIYRNVTECRKPVLLGHMPVPVSYNTVTTEMNSRDI